MSLQIILLNFLLLAIDHHGMDSEFADKIETTNVRRDPSPRCDFTLNTM